MTRAEKWPHVCTEPVARHREWVCGWCHVLAVHALRSWPEWQPCPARGSASPPATTCSPECPHLLSSSPYPILELSCPTRRLSAPQPHTWEEKCLVHSGSARTWHATTAPQILVHPISNLVMDEDARWHTGEGAPPGCSGTREALPRLFRHRVAF